jgi:DNA-binding transcriptional LysR family regulator
VQSGCGVDVEVGGVEASASPEQQLTTINNSVRAASPRTLWTAPNVSSRSRCVVHSSVTDSSTTPPSPPIVLRELSREPMVYVCSPAHPLAGRTQVDVADLTTQKLI